MTISPLSKHIGWSWDMDLTEKKSQQGRRTLPASSKTLQNSYPKPLLCLTRRCEAEKPMTLFHPILANISHVVSQANTF
jgi:hypothetical protein